MARRRRQTSPNAPAAEYIRNNLRRMDISSWGVFTGNVVNNGRDITNDFTVMKGS